MALSKEDQKRIAKISTISLTAKVQFGRFEGEELEYAKSLLRKRHINIDQILINVAARSQPSAEEEPSASADLPELFTLPENDGPQTQEEYDALQTQTVETTRDPLIETVEALEPVKPAKEKKPKATKKSGKPEKKIYIDQNGKEMTKSDLMRRLIRLKHSIKPKELNDQLIDAGFSKAYHSEIQRCREQMGVVAPSKVEEA